MLILGWEPGGGAAPECEATDPPVTKSAFFYDADTGEKLGQWTLPRPQTAEENCTIHNYNVVPVRGRYALASGNYQAGTWLTDFRSGQRVHARVLGSAADHADAARRSLVVVLVQPRDLRVQHHGRVEHLPVAVLQHPAAGVPEAPAAGFTRTGRRAAPSDATWSAATIQIDAVNIDAGFGHQHVPQFAGAATGALPPDTLPEGTGATGDG